MGSSRRAFITQAVSGVLALLGIGFLVPAARLFIPANARDRGLVFFPLIPEDDIPMAGIKKAELVYEVAGSERKSRVFIITSPEGPVVLSAVCSHLGCLVNYHRDKQEFVCPCHGGRYDRSGRNIAGPPPAPLTRFPLKIEKGMVMVGIKV